MFMLINHFFCKTQEWALESTSVLSMLTLSLGGVSGPPGGKCMCAENAQMGRDHWAPAGLASCFWSQSAGGE